jgi:hypothetical protein
MAFNEILISYCINNTEENLAQKSFLTLLELAKYHLENAGKIDKNDIKNEFYLE